MFWREGRGSRVDALDGVSLNIYDEEITGVRGPSGSGKSTLLHLMAALDVPTSGRVLVSGENTSEMSEGERTKLRLSKVGIVFQSFRLFPSLSARSNVAMPLVEKGMSKSGRRSRAEHLLEEVGLGDRVKHKPGELSGGEQQRVAIARALAVDPDIVVADEPTGEIDSETGKKILEIFRELSDNHAVIVASHDRETLEVADRAVEMMDGKITSS